MIRSMTGFASASITLPREIKDLHFSLEIKTLNSRFFEVSCRLPGSLSHLEHRIVSILKKEIGRGKTYLVISEECDSESLHRMEPTLAVAENYVQAARVIQEHCKLSGTLSISDVVALPHVFVFKKESLTFAQEEALFQGVEHALTKLEEQRSSEGARLVVDMKRSFHLCKEAIKKIASQASEMLIAKKQEVQTALTAEQAGDEMAKVRLEEMYRMIDKIDIHEEIIRFESHLTHIHEILESAEKAHGRRLDFTLQELMREINTITAKCSNFAISSAAVDIKVELEKAREQIQNIV